MRSSESESLITRWYEITDNGISNNSPVGVLLSARLVGAAVQSSERAAIARRVTEAVVTFMLDLL